MIRLPFRPSQSPASALSPPAAPAHSTRKVREWFDSLGFALIRYDRTPRPIPPNHTPSNHRPFPFLRLLCLFAAIPLNTLIHFDSL
jgi:hypothetical protein